MNIISDCEAHRRDEEFYAASDRGELTRRRHTDVEHARMSERHEESLQREKQCFDHDTEEDGERE